MKKLLFGLACLALIMSCEIPRSIVVKGTPELYVPLGSPFTEEENLAAYISADKIREMMDENTATTDSAHQLKIYDYQGTDDIDGITEGTLTYMVHYPIASMELDIGKYVNQAMNSEDLDAEFNIPQWDDYLPYVNDTAFTMAFPQGAFLAKTKVQNQDQIIPNFFHNESTPAASIPMTEMSKLLKEVTGTEFGLQMTWSQELQESLKLYIPAFGIGEPTNYKSGDKVGDKLQFVGTRTIFNPNQHLDNGALKVYVQVIKPITGKIVLEEIFKWKKATIDTSGENFTGEYPIENALGNFLGTGVTFKNVQGYIYVNGIEGNVNISLTANGDDLLEGKGSSFQEVELLSRLPADTKTPFTASLLPHSLGDTAETCIDLDTILNSSSSRTTLQYSIKLPELDIEEEEDYEEQKITADMIILLPLELAINTSVSGTGFEDYVKLDLGQDEFSMGSGDLFGRGNSGGSNNDDLFNSLEEVTILLKPLTGNNDISQSITAIDVDKLAILMKLKNGSNKLITFDQGYTPPLEMDHDSWGYLELTLNQDDGDFDYPFNPEFEILLKRDDGADSPATFQIKQQEAGAEPQFDFNLAVQAKANINQTIVEF